GPPPASQVTVQCSGDQAVLELVAPGSPEPLRRTVQLRQVATSARERVLALAISELLSAAPLSEVQPARPQLPAVPVPSTLSALSSAAEAHTESKGGTSGPSRLTVGLFAK